MAVSAADPEAARRLLRASAGRQGGLCVLTGAGMSAESGIATFRDALTGLWSRFDPQQLASEDGFRADPKRVRAWYAERRAGVLAAAPNAGHRALAAWQRRHPGALVLVTQNVDDLHQRAGVADTIRLHGDIVTERWLDPCTKRPACAVQPPRCTLCGSWARPNVVWFGEMLPQGAFEAAQSAALHCRVLLVVGTSGAVWPAAGLAAMARAAGASVLIVNPEPSDIDAEAHLLIRGSAAAVLPCLLNESPDADQDRRTVSTPAGAALPGDPAE